MPTDVISYNGIEYAFEDLEELTVLAQKDLFNEVSSALGLPGIPKFPDRHTGATRLYARLKEYAGRITREDLDWEAADPNRREAHGGLVSSRMEDVPASSNDPNETEPDEEESVTSSSSSPIRRKRQKYFNFPVMDEIKVPRKGTLRERVLTKLLADGLTFDQVVVEVTGFDGDRKGEGKDLRGSDDHPSRRAYEILRIIHYILGYGMRQSEETGVITVFTK